VEVSPGERVTAVRVTDQGEGFAAHQRAHAFDRFVTWDAERGDGERTGLGLAIAQGLVDAHGGRIWLEPGPGGRVAFEVPVAGRRAG
jgi:signal transduction histidine kinase